MADALPGAAAPIPAAVRAAHSTTTNAAPTPRPPLRLVATTARRRRNHGAFMLGGQLACIYSTPRAGCNCGVSFELGAGALMLAGALTPGQARTMARALAAAADAAEAVQGGAA